MLYDGRLLLNSTKVSFVIYLVLFWIFTETSFHSFAINAWMHFEQNKDPKFTLPFTPHKCSSTFKLWYFGWPMCWQYTQALSLNLSFPFPVSPIYLSNVYFSIRVSQMTARMMLKVLHRKWCLNLNVTWKRCKCAAAKGAVIIYQDHLSNRLSYRAMSSACTQSQLCTATPISLFAQCPISFRLLPLSVATFILIEVFLR